MVGSHLLDRRFGQLPGAGDVGVLEALHHLGGGCSILFGTIATLMLIYCGPTIQIDLLFGRRATERRRGGRFGIPDGYVTPAPSSPRTRRLQGQHLSSVVVLPAEEPLHLHDDRRLSRSASSSRCWRRSGRREEGFTEVERRALLGEPRGAAARVTQRATTLDCYNGTTAGRRPVTPAFWTVVLRERERLERS